MIGGSEHLDAEDRAFLESLVPDNALDPQMIAVVSWVDAESGDGLWRAYSPDEVLVSHKLGLLEMAKAYYMTFVRMPGGDDG